MIEIKLTFVVISKKPKRERLGIKLITAEVNEVSHFKLRKRGPYNVSHDLAYYLTETEREKPIKFCTLLP